MSVGLPSWQSLIDHLLNELGLRAKHAADSEANYHTLAEYYRIKQGSIGPLRSWMDRHWKISEEKVRDSKVHQLIVQLDFPLIYTTNYDLQHRSRVRRPMAGNMSKSPMHAISPRRAMASPRS